MEFGKSLGCAVAKAIVRPKCNNSLNHHRHHQCLVGATTCCEGAVTFSWRPALFGLKMAVDDDFDIPETGAVFTFGKSRFADNAPSKFWVKNDIIVEIACGDEHTAVLTESGRVFTIGRNDIGQLGLGTAKPVTKPSCVKSLKPEKVMHVGCGRSHTIAACFSGAVYLWGHNGDGQLGTGDHTDHLLPVQVLKLEAPAAGVAAGSAHSVVLTEDGELYAWGSNSEGQLGLDVDEQLTPRLVKVPEPLVSVACGYYHNVAVSGSGQVYTWGESNHGKLGLSDGHLTLHQHPQEVILPEKVVQVAAGNAHTLFLTESGAIYSCGLGSNGELGQGGEELECWLPKPVLETNTKQIVAIAAGANHSSAITADGFLLSWGCGRHGKLCHGEENFTSEFSPVTVRRLRHIKVVLVGCGGCHTMVLGCRRPEKQEDWDEPREESQILKSSSSVSARDRRRLVNGTLPPLKSTGLPLKHTVSPTVPDLEDVANTVVESEPLDIADAGDSDSIGEPICHGEEPPGNVMSESESEEESVTEESVKNTENAHSPEKKTGRVAHFFKSLGRKKSSQRSLALCEQAISLGKNGATDSTDGSLEGNTLGSIGSEGVKAVKEAFNSRGIVAAIPDPGDPVNQKQSKTCVIV